ncbi:MAG: hypothetical protein R2724_07175 [Bryobacterales bacterium]
MRQLLMLENQTPNLDVKRGLGFGLGEKAGSPGCSERIVWAHRLDRHAHLGPTRRRTRSALCSTRCRPDPSSRIRAGIAAE